ncbi:MAG: helix-turn-helix domain-containing protein [Gammaproteobacteria bacterium]
MATQNSPLLTRKQAAEYLGIETETLHNWACTKRYNLKFYKVGRLAKYRKEDLDAFLSERAVNGREEG